MERPGQPLMSGKENGTSAALHRASLASRRSFLVASTCGLAGMTFGRPVSADSQVRAPGRAKSTILFFLSGGASHIDMWDMKPNAPAEYRGPFQPIATSAPGVRLVRASADAGQTGPSSGDSQQHSRVGQHERSSRGLLLQLDRACARPDVSVAGQQSDALSLMTGPAWERSWREAPAASSSCRTSLRLPQKGGRPAYTRPGQFAARLGLEFEPLYVEGDSKNPLKFQVPALVLQRARRLRV
jgi:hypothetical protein